MKVYGEGRLEQIKDREGNPKRVTRNGKKCLVWRGRFSFGINSLTDKSERSPWRTFYGNKGDARKGMEAYRNELERGISVGTDVMVFSEWAELFCSGREAKNAASPATLKHDRNQVRILNMYLGNVKLKDITSLMVEHILVMMGKDGRSANAIKRALTMLKRLMTKACSKNIILCNPTDDVDAPRVTRPEIKALSETRVAALLKALRTQPDHLTTASEQNKLSHLGNVVATRLLLATGCRRGEIIGLFWRHVNIEASKVRIEQQLTVTGIRQPKTRAGRRTITIDAETVAMVREWKRIQAELLLKKGIAQNEDTPVISTTGHLYHVDDYTGWWRRFRKIIGFQDVTTHMLRHTHATLLIAAGVDIKTVQGRLGHESAAITMNLYAHYIEHKDFECASVMEALNEKGTDNLGEVIGF